MDPKFSIDFKELYKFLLIIIYILKSLVILWVWLVLFGAIYSQIASILNS